MWGAVVLGMTSLVIIFAVFLRSRRSFIQSMRLMSIQIKKMRPNVLNSSINPTMKQHSAPWAQDYIYVLSKTTILIKALAEEMENPVGSVGLLIEGNDCWNRFPFWISQPQPQGKLERGKLTLLDYLAGVCQDAQPDWLRCLSGQVIPSWQVV